MSYSLGIDIGTSGIRTAVLDEDGQVVAMARADHLPQDPEQIDADLWWQAVVTCICNQSAALSEQGIDPGDIKSVAVDGTSGSMVLTDANLTPVSRALMYNSKGFDAEAQQISKHAPATHITQGSGSALGRAMRLISEDSAGAAKHVLHQADFIAAKLMGTGGHSDDNNALKTGYDPETGDWPAWFADLIPMQLLPTPSPVGTPIDLIAPKVALDLGLAQDVMVHAGTTDSIAAFLAASPLDVGNAVTSIGSTLAIKLLSHERIDDPGIGLYAHRLGDLWLLGGASNTGGAVLAHYFSVAEIERLSARMAPTTPTGLDYYPLIRDGERFPINDPGLKPRLTPRPDDDARFLQGMFEGIAEIERLCYAEIASRGAGHPKTIYSAGGATRNPALRRIRERVLGTTLAEAAQTEAAVGAAICASGHLTAG